MSFLVVTMVAGASACADPVATSENISIKLGGIKEGEIADGQASEEKNVKEEDGNPYKTFLAEARANLDGADPGAILVSSAFVRMRSDSTGVVGFEDVFASMEVFLSTSETTIPIGTVAAPSGTSQEVTLLVDADLSAVHEEMLKGDFKVGVRGPTVASPPAKFELKLTLDIVFEALE